MRGLSAQCGLCLSLNSSGQLNTVNSVSDSKRHILATAKGILVSRTGLVSEPTVKPNYSESHIDDINTNFI